MRSAKPSAPAQMRLRCAVYTRKSTEEGLDQAFNSLDAQREACEAYILSQRHEGWVLHPDRYDDGGFTGGNMDRPGLKQLLADTALGRVDVVVVYKVDRLTRALSDFAKIVEVLDKADAAFVSVTQAFNTTSSMGRLTLNVLLSFAQFEREVISERVRDKIAASKARGMWMGGSLPLGYEVRDRKLVIVKTEAETVRHIMRRYIELRSVRALAADLKQTGIVTKRQQRRDGSVRGGVPFARGPLYHLLKNRIYIGQITHRDQIYAGEHDAIVDLPLFERVQALLKANAVERRSGSGTSQPSLLAGLIRDEQGRALTPTHACKGNKRYRYYEARDVEPGEVVRLPATEIERATLIALGELLSSTDRLSQAWSDADATSLRRMLQAAKQLAAQLPSLSPPVLHEQLRTVGLQLTVSDLTVSASICSKQLACALGNPAAVAAEAFIVLAMPALVRSQRHGLRLRFDAAASRAPDTQLVQLMARVRQARDQLTSMPAAQLSDVSHRRELTRLARLSYLAPDIVTAILDGRQPVHFQVRDLLRIGDLPIDWQDQRSLLRFA